MFKKGKVSQGELENGIWKKGRKGENKREEDDKNRKERSVTQVKRYEKTRRRENRNVER